MASLAALLRSGYFPKELPPPFTTASFSNVMVGNRTKLPGDLLPNYRGRFSVTARLMSHNVVRVGTLRRKLGIPNPILHFHLSDQISNHWPRLRKFIEQKTYSSSRPQPNRGGIRALVSAVRPRDWPALRVKHRTNCKYVLKTDVASCYGSIYTHSIAWALHTKATAKQHRNDFQYIGNRLDYWVRAAQDQQSVGIPIGPDTSFLIAEIVLRAIDELLEKEIGPLRGCRAIDDYELCFLTYSEAEQALSSLEGILSDYGLNINARKTQILELPQPINARWVYELSRFKLRSTPYGQGIDLTEFFNTAFQLAHEFQEDSILRYALARVRNENILPFNWRLYQALLLQCAAAEPGTLPHVLAEFVKYHLDGRRIARVALCDTLNMLITRHVPLGHGSEAAWALWGAIAFGLQIDTDTTKVLAKAKDSIVALLALDANARGLVPGGIDTTEWERLMTKGELLGEHWLLAYEANVKGWLPSVGGGDHVSADARFRHLKQMGVSFYDSSLASPVIPNAIAPIEGGSASVDLI